MIMKTQIRKNIFETNSSSTHAVSIFRGSNYSIPEKIVIRPGEFGWECETFSDPESKLAYLYTWILSKCRSYEYNEVRPRTYRIKAQKEFTDFSKSKRKNQKKIRKEIKKLLQYIRRNVDFINKFEIAGKKISVKNKNKLGIVQKVYNQQKEMYQNKTHRCEDRIVSLSEPFVRPIVRGKAKSPVEFGAKLDLSIDNKGNARIEKLSFDAYNESEVLQKAIEGLKKLMDIIQKEF